MRAIGYFRTGDGEEASQEPRKAFLDYCRLNSHQPVETFGDVPDGAAQGAPQFQRMVRYMQESGSEFLVVVPDGSHLGDDLESVARALVELEGIGAKVICADRDFPDPVQNAFQTLGIKGVSRTRSSRIKESMRARALQGRALGRPMYGYRIGESGTLEVVPSQAAVVELIFRLYVKDELGLRLIAQHLNERDIPTKRGGRWSVVGIRDILRNPTCMGTYTRFGMRVSRAHEPIISPELFRAAQELAKSRRPFGRVASYEPFLLSGIAYCGYCNNKMMGVTRRQSWKRKDERRVRGVYKYYQCQSRNNQSLCGYHTWRAPLLESTVLGQLKYAALAKKSGTADADSTSRRREEMRGALVKNAEGLFVRAMKRAARGEVSVQVLGEYLKELDEARSRANDTGAPADLAEALERWESMDVSERQALLAEHVARIVVKDDAVEVVV